jgi:hypothetical protein
MVDDEYANESRAVALLIRFKNGMTSVWNHIQHSLTTSCLMFPEQPWNLQL